MAKHILITGATGFLGSQLLKRLTQDKAASGFQITALKRSTSNLARISNHVGQIQTYDIDRIPLEHIFKENRFDVIIHCATNYGRRSIPPTEVIEANLTLPLHLLQLAASHGVPAFINTDTILDKRVSHYSLSKKQFLDWLHLFSKQLNCVNVALEHFYGPQDDSSKFVSFIIQQLINDVPHIDLTLGSQRRGFIHVEDVAEAFVTIIHSLDTVSTKSFTQYEVGMGDNVSIKSLVEQLKILAKNTKTELRFGALPLRENEVMNSIVEGVKLRALGWSPKITLAEGLRRTVDEELKVKSLSYSPAQAVSTR